MPNMTMAWGEGGKHHNDLVFGQKSLVGINMHGNDFFGKMGFLL